VIWSDRKRSNWRRAGIVAVGLLALVTVVVAVLALKRIATPILATLLVLGGLALA
jgi:hypothetical protein